MKRIIIAGLITSFFVFFSCKKVFDESGDKSKIEETSFNRSSNQDVPISIFEYTDRNGQQQQMLVFLNSDDYFKQLDILDELDERHEQDFLDRHPNATELEINRFDSIEHFDEYQVYKDFNYRYNFESQLFKYIEAENAWLNDPNLSPTLDPDLLFYGLDINELSILNADWAFMYRNKEMQQIVKYYSDGIVLITDGDIRTLNQISGVTSIKDAPIDKFENCESFDNGNTSLFCISANREQDYRTIGTKKRIKGVVKVKKFQAYSNDSNHNGFIEPNEYGVVITNNKVKVKAKTIKKRWWGGWWRYRVSEIKAAIDGEAAVGNCGSSNTITFDKNVNYKEHHNWAKAKYKKAFPNPKQGYMDFTGLYIEDDAVWGYFYSHNHKRFKLDFSDGTFVPY